MPQEQAVTLLCTDRKNSDGSPITQEFGLEYAQRILNVKHPNKGWTLQDANYKMVNGVITPAQKILED